MHRRILFFLATIIFAGSGHASVAFSKYRLYFDQSTRSDSLQITNKGSTPLTFSSQLALIEMTEEGSMLPVEESEHSAKDFIRYTPKRGTVAPGMSQAIRLALRKPAGIEDGEYRAVLKLSVRNKSEQTSGVNLRPTLNYSLPILVRHGRTQASTEIKQPGLVMLKGTPHLQLWQTREGNRSIFGNYVVTNQSGDEVGRLNNVAVYRPLKRRRVLIPLNAEFKGKGHVTFEEVEQYGGTNKVVAEINLQ